MQGFKNISRHEGFDLDCSKLVLRDLAKFQGTAIGLKLKQPKIFNEKIKAYCHNFNFPMKLPWYQSLAKAICEENPACVHLAGKVAEWPSPRTEPREPYASIAHGDLWVNNTMQKFENGKIVENKFVDFQLYSYRSCASDVFFFLWTSCQMSVLQNHLDYLLKYYHDTLIETLKELNCDTDEFSFDKFLEELRLESEFEFGHSFVFVMGVKSKLSIPEAASTFRNNINLSDIPLELREFYDFMILECNKRGWLH